MNIHYKFANVCLFNWKVLYLLQKVLIMFLLSELAEWFPQCVLGSMLNPFLLSICFTSKIPKHVIFVAKTCLL